MTWGLTPPCCSTSAASTELPAIPSGTGVLAQPRLRSLGSTTSRLQVVVRFPWGWTPAPREAQSGTIGALPTILPSDTPTLKGALRVMAARGFLGAAVALGHRRIIVPRQLRRLTLAMLVALLGAVLGAVLCVLANLDEFDERAPPDVALHDPRSLGRLWCGYDICAENPKGSGRHPRSRRVHPFRGCRLRVWPMGADEPGL